MFPGFSSALSALTADSNAIDVCGNNLANLNTPGFKAAQVEFSDLMSETIGGGLNPAQIGMGVGPIGTNTNYIQGAITTTNGPTDAAIEGNGFFVVQDPGSGQTLYTRDGSFQVDSAGNLVTAGGQNVQGWLAVNGTVNPNGPTSNLTVPTGALVPGTTTTTMSLDVNLNAGATAGSGSTFSAPIQVYDSLGTSHTLTVNFTETAANSWSYTVTIPASDLASGGNTTLASGTMTFDGNGNLTSPAPGSGPQTIAIQGLADGANNMSIGWNLFNAAGDSNITQLSETSSLEGETQNGMAPGQITNVTLQNGGLLMANYSNGQQVTVGQLAMAGIQNPNTLISVGNNNLEASAETAPVVLGGANTGSGRFARGIYLRHGCRIH
jgi:flagellar hook protein FlgE